MNFVLIIGLLLIFGLISTRVMKICKLPNVTGYLIIGLIVALGCVLTDYLSNNFFGLTEELNGLNEFVSDIALGFIALSIGEEFKLSKIKKYGAKIVSITFLQAMLAVVFVDILLAVFCVLLNVPVEISICLGAIATATAPAATIMVINQYKAKGPLVDLLLPVVAFDDAIGLIVFAISVSIAKVLATNTPITIVSVCLLPLLEIVGSLAIGLILGYFMHLMIKFFKSRNNHVILIIAFTLLGVGICASLNQLKIDGEALEFSNLLCCMMIGATYINIAKQDEKDIAEREFGLVERWTPFLFMLFFVLSGAHLVTSAKSMLETGVSLGIVAVIFVGYVFMRSLGKYIGAMVGCKLTHRSKEITRYLGITLLPQAGVAIGMANQISGMEAFKANGSGNIIVTVVLCATLVYELIGPLLTKWSLQKAGEIPDENGVYPYEKNEQNSLEKE